MIIASISFGFIDFISSFIVAGNSMLNHSFRPGKVIVAAAGLLS